MSTRSLTRLSEAIRGKRAALGERWRRLPAHEQALMTLAHLRNGDTLTRLAAGFAVSVSTVWRYPREAVEPLAVEAEDLAEATRRAAKLAYALLDGALIPIDRVGPVSAPAFTTSNIRCPSLIRSYTVRFAVPEIPVRTRPGKATSRT